MNNIMYLYGDTCTSLAMFLDLEIPPFAFLLIAFVVVKTVLASLYSGKQKELRRTQRSAEEEAAFLEAQAEVKRKIAAQKHSQLESVQDVVLASIAKGLKEDLASLQKPLRPALLKVDAASAKPFQYSEPALVAPPKKHSSLQKAFVASLIFSKPKALEESAPIPL
jgi:hypothetical protein